jgi:hypothetical protein
MILRIITRPFEAQGEIGPPVLKRRDAAPHPAALKGKRRLNDLAIPDVINVPRVFNGNPTGVAAMHYGRDFLGADAEADAVMLATARMRETGGISDPAVMRIPAQLSLMG